MAKAGKLRRIYLTTVTGEDPVVTTNTWISGEISNSLNINRETIGFSDKASEWDDFLAGKGSWDASASFNLDNSADGKQKELLQSLVSGTKVKLFIGELAEGAQSDGIGGDAIITSISESSDVGGVVSRDISFRGCGAPVPVYPAGSGS